MKKRPGLAQLKKEIYVRFNHKKPMIIIYKSRVEKISNVPVSATLESYVDSIQSLYDFDLLVSTTI